MVETKPDLTPVTEADRAVEELVRRALERERPADAVLGEELGVQGSGDRRWIIDPIDGTSGFVRGLPVWASLFALERDGQLVLGVVSAPALGRRWWAARGRGAFADGAPARVSRVARLEDAHLSYDSVPDFEAVGLGEPFLALARRCARTRGLGDFWGHVLVADGSLDVSVEVGGMQLWDLAPLQVIVEEAGGRFTDLDGNARADAGTAVATNGLLHEDVLAALRA